MISFEDFKKLELKVGKILEVNLHPSADRLYIVKVDLGNSDVRELVAGIRPYYAPEELINKQVIIVANLEPATIRGITSNGMLLAAKDDTTLAILTIDRPVKEGSPVS
ncbi:MAG: hypothetical protein V2A65_03515 [Candidatus Omnitrophota bacterium]